jgi:hypothetical protein
VSNKHDVIPLGNLLRQIRHTDFYVRHIAGTGPGVPNLEHGVPNLKHGVPFKNQRLYSEELHNVITVAVFVQYSIYTVNFLVLNLTLASDCCQIRHLVLLSLASPRVKFSSSPMLKLNIALV